LLLLISTKARKENNGKTPYENISWFWTIGYFIYRGFKKSSVSMPASIGGQFPPCQTEIYAEQALAYMAKYPCAFIDGDPSIINSINWSFANSVSKERCLFARISRGTACSAGKFTSSCSNSMEIRRPFIQGCAIGAGSASWTGSMLKAEAGPADPAVSVFRFEFRMSEGRPLTAVRCIDKAGTLLQPPYFTGCSTHPLASQFPVEIRVKFFESKNVYSIYSLSPSMHAWSLCNHS
jgi:hypothetical protein